MKLEESGPPRLDEDDTELGRLVRVGRSRKMTSAASGRIAERLTAAGAFSAAAPPSTARPSWLGRFGSTKLVALAFVGLGGAFVVSQTRSYVVSPPPPAMIASASVSSIENAKSAPKQGTPLPEAPLPEAPSPEAPSPETPAVSVDALPAPAQIPQTTVVANTPVPSATTRPVAPRDTTTAHKAADSEMEFALIRRAQAVVASAPAQALALTAEHARVFPSGELAQERELTAVEALAHLGRRDEAKQRAEALVSRFPRTPYIARLEHAIGEPLSPVPPSKTVR